MRRVTIAAVLILAAAPVAADIVYLRGGKTIEGKVSRDARTGDYRIETPRGTVTKPASEVLRVEKCTLPEEQFRRQLRKTKRDDLDGLSKLVSYAREKGLADEKKTVCKLILVIDPNHEMARRELGYIVFQNEWVLEKEVRKKREELGLVKHLGEWMTTAERDRRVHEADREELAGLMKSIQSDNRVVTDFAVRKILDYSGKRAYDLFLPYLDAPHENVRLVAVSALSKFPPRNNISGTKKEAAAVARRLWTLYLSEPSPKVLAGLKLCLRIFDPPDSFRRAIETLQTTTIVEERERADKATERLLVKSLVPTLCRALVTRRAATAGSAPSGTTRTVQHAAIRALLVRIFQVDHGYDVRAWLAWWTANSTRFRDSP